MKNFARLDRLPPYVFEGVKRLKMEYRHNGVDVIDFGMGNPDLATPSILLINWWKLPEKRPTIAIPRPEA